jgi:hypothetical protein
MNFSPARWAVAVTAAVLIALPGSALAQATPTQNPPSQPPGQTQPAAAPSQNGQADPAITKKRLTEARDTLAQLTSMPEAAKLQGETRNQVSQLISNFNAMIATPNDWRAAYAKVNDSLTGLLGPDTDQGTAGTTGTAATTGTTGTAGTTGTTGTAEKPATPDSAAGATPQLDPAIRAKLVEFRSHLNAFAKAAGGGSSGTTGTTGATGGTRATESSVASASPSASNPALNPSSGSSTAATAPSAATTPSAATAPTAAPAAPAAAAAAAAAAGTEATPQSELAAIDAILAESKTGALTKEQTAEIRRHIEALRAMLTQK